MTPTTTATLRTILRIALIEARARLDARQSTLDERAQLLAMAQRDRDTARSEVAALEEAHHELWPTHDAATATTPRSSRTFEPAATLSPTPQPSATAYPTHL